MYDCILSYKINYNSCLCFYRTAEYYIFKINMLIVYSLWVFKIKIEYYRLGMHSEANITFSLRILTLIQPKDLYHIYIYTGILHF